MKVDPIGPLEKINDHDWESGEVEVPLLSNMACRFVLDGFGPEVDVASFQVSIKEFLSLSESDFNDVANYLYEYYKDIRTLIGPEDMECEHIGSADQIKDYVGFSGDISVSKREEDGLVYLSIEGGCDWEEEHGLQIVFQGKTLVMAGSFTGHLTNADAYDDPSLEKVIYKKLT